MMMPICGRTKARAACCVAIAAKKRPTASFIGTVG